MSNVYFFTGFPGFIATNLVKGLLSKDYNTKRIYLLVLPAMKERAKREVNRLILAGHATMDRFTIVEGDITKESLGLDPQINERLGKEVTHVFHLAAICDLAVSKKLAYQVNVLGTERVNQWLLALEQLERYVYFSTAYVAGTREGRTLETELDMGQSFKNHYESTKYEAEVLVRKLMLLIPTTIIRPGIVVGDSQTGETAKFDGLYFMLNFFNRLRSFSVIPYLGKGDAEGNFVPVDYILNATLYLGHAEIGIGTTYQLTDPRPYKIKEVYRMLMKEFLGREPKGTIPLSWAKVFLSVSKFRKWSGTEKEALDYFTCRAVYDSSETQRDLEGSGIACPDLKLVIPAIVEYYNRHKNDRNKHVRIK